MPKPGFLGRPTLRTPPSPLRRSDLEALGCLVNVHSFFGMGNDRSDEWPQHQPESVRTVFLPLLALPVILGRGARRTIGFGSGRVKPLRTKRPSRDYSDLNQGSTISYTGYSMVSALSAVWLLDERNGWPSITVIRMGW
jgi:hypothetical protein